MTPEFSRIERLDTIGADTRSVTVTADEHERAALAKRFGLMSIESLVGAFTLRREAAGVIVNGRVDATLVQACSVTGDPLDASVDEPVALLFVEPGKSEEAEVELGADTIDTVELEGGGVDLGETAAETMALALDPFPRSPGAEAALRAAGVIGEDEAGPFGALAGLKAKLKGE